MAITRDGNYFSGSGRLRSIHSFTAFNGDELGAGVSAGAVCGVHVLLVPLPVGAVAGQECRRSEMYAGTWMSVGMEAACRSSSWLN